MSGVDIKSISPILKKRIEKDSESKTEKKERFARIRNAINRKAKPNKKNN